MLEYKYLITLLYRVEDRVFLAVPWATLNAAFHGVVARWKGVTHFDGRGS